MSEELREWLDRELQDFEPVWKSFRSKQRKMYYIWMVVAVVGMVALGFGVGYDLAYVLRVHLLIGIGIAAFIWLCVLLTGKANTMKNARKQFEKALVTLSPSDQEAFVRQDFGRTNFLNTTEDGFPSRLLIGPDFWLYFRGICHIYRVSDITALGVQEETTRLHYTVGNKRVRQKVGVGISLTVEYREGTISAKDGSDRIYLANREQLQTAKSLITQHCPKVETLWR